MLSIRISFSGSKSTRAAAIAELVLWIGYLQLHYSQSTEHPSEPILKTFDNIKNYDAVLTWNGYPLPQIVDGKETYPNPRKPDWPMADYIVGNPPFVGGKDIRSRMGDGYVEALWAAHKKVNNSADFVMYWWDRAAELLTAKGSRLKRFGLVTTNSITQVFQRRVIERHLTAQKPISLLLAIPDHPWTKVTRDSAAVRIAMTVAAAGTHDGVLLEVTREADLGEDQPIVELAGKVGKINADLSVGVDVTQAKELLANTGLSSPGVKLHGDGFIVSPSEAEALGLGRIDGLDKHIRAYRNGRDLTSRPRGVIVIDLFGLEADEVRQRFPEVYQHLMVTVRPQREITYDKSGTRDAAEYLDKWWQFGKPRQDLRPALANLNRYVVTVETMKHRVFQFLNAEVLPDNKLIAIATDDGFALSILHSKVHEIWYLANAGKLGVYERDAVYVKSRCFDPFPFPDPVPETLKEQLRAAAEELDETRKAVLEAHGDLTLTKLYNVLEKVRAERPALSSAPRKSTPHPTSASLQPPSGRSPRAGSSPSRGEGEEVGLTAEEMDIRDRGRVLILKDLHETIDRLTFEAYGWPADLSDEEILGRLVALNKERADEEAKGQVRWLRPEYQIPRFGTPTEKKQQLEAELVSFEDIGKPSFPKEETRRAIAISGVLAAASAPLSAAEIAARFKQGRRIEKDIALTLRSFLRFGDVVSADGGTTYALRRVA